MPYQAPLQHMRYLLRDVFNASEQWAQMPAFAALDEATVNAILEEGAKLCAEVIAPLSRPGDEEGARLVKGQAITPKGFREAYQQVASGGWVATAACCSFRSSCSCCSCSTQQMPAQRVRWLM